jgi:nicotinamidase-related amidase
MELDRTRTALLALHFERDTIEPEGAFGSFFHEMIVRDGVLEHTSDALAAARAAGVPVIYARVQFDADYPGLDASTILNGSTIAAGALLAGTPGTEFVEAVAPQDGDAVVDHAGGTSAFCSPDLAPFLVEHGIDTLVVAGVSTNVIVAGTVHDAVNRGMRVYVLGDCCACGDDATQQATLGTLQMVSHGVETSTAFVKALESARV